MGDPLSAVASTIAVVGCCCRVAKDLYTFVDHLASAPDHISSLSCELKGLYSVLRTMHRLLQDGDSAKGVLHSKNTQRDLEIVLGNCMRTMRELSIIMKSFLNKEGDVKKTLWKRFLFNFKSSEITTLRTNLLEQKITLNLAIGAAN
jgi:hypothetical protein